jgi:hypothetical protein
MDKEAHLKSMVSLNTKIINHSCLQYRLVTFKIDLIRFIRILTMECHKMELLQTNLGHMEVLLNLGHLHT